MDKTTRKIRAIFAGLTALLIFALLPTTTQAAALGPRGGYDFDTEQFVIGVEGEFGRALQAFRFAPSLDFELGDANSTMFNADFRLYLFNLPETGLRFYGSAGPTIVLDSPRDETDIGLSLVAGMKIPMKNQNRYHLETRFGIGDIPDFKLMAAVMFEL